MTGLTRGGAVSEEWIRTKWRTLYNIVLTSDSPKSIWRVDPVEPIGKLGKSCTKLGISECSHSKSTTLSNFVSLTQVPKSTPIDIWRVSRENRSPVRTRTRNCLIPVKHRFLVESSTLNNMSIVPLPENYLLPSYELSKFCDLAAPPRPALLLNWISSERITLEIWTFASG